MFLFGPNLTSYPFNRYPSMNWGKIWTKFCSFHGIFSFLLPRCILWGTVMLLFEKNKFVFLFWVGSCHPLVENSWISGKRIKSVWFLTDLLLCKCKMAGQSVLLATCSGWIQGPKMSFQWAWNNILLLLGVHGKWSYLNFNNIFLYQGILLIESTIFTVTSLLNQLQILSSPLQHSIMG